MGNTILIIGNGFDLYHKLPTRYTDFLFLAKHWEQFKGLYDKNEKVEKEEAQYEVRLDESGCLDDNSLEDFAAHKNSFDESHIAYLDMNLTSNRWIEYFGKIKLPGKNWIDFESEIENALIIVEQYYGTFLLAHINDVPSKTIPDRMNLVIKTFEPKKDSLYKDLSANLLHPRDAEPEKLVINKERLLANMKMELDKLNRCLDYYLLEFVGNIKCSVYSEQIKALRDVHLLNFNYTYTYRTVYGSEKLKLHHPVHGDVMNENMVLGITDESFEQTLDYVYFQKYFQRIQKKTGNFYKSWVKRPKDTALEDSPAQVYIMGHSLSKADHGILKDFFMERNVDKITIYYHNQSAYESMIINLVEMFGKDFVIDQTANERIVFEELKSPVKLVDTIKRDGDK